MKRVDNDNVLNHVLMIVIVEVDIVHVYVIMIVACHVLNEVRCCLYVFDCEKKQKGELFSKVLLVRF